jgi:glycosyltransferase involved in cell wall biosynthesis
LEKIISVVIPIYNAESYLDRCIASVIGQSYKELDIILVDDGSTDGSAAICCEWEKKDKRIAYIYKKNAGLGAARNTGIKAAKTEYITFLDADDWFEVDFIEKIINAMLNTKSDIGMCDIYYVNSSTMLRELVKIRFDKTVVSSRDDRSVITKSRLFAWGKIYKKSLFADFDIAYPQFTYEDIITPLLVACSNQVAYIPEPLINYLRGRQGSLSNDSKNIDDISKGLHLLHKKFWELDVYEKYKLEYKKIALAQFRFACRKWGELNELENSISDTIPELKEISKKKYFAFGKMPASALDKALPYAWQVVDDISSADYIVAFDSEYSLIPQSAAQRIVIPAIAQISEDNVTTEYNIADLVMEFLY